MYFAVIFYAITIVSLLLNVNVVDAAKFDYCNAKLCRGLNHIGCGNNGTFAKDCLKSAKIQGMKKCLREAIVQKHNEFRNLVASGSFSSFKPAGHMCTMRWDAELAKLAELNVKRCIIKYDACHNTVDFYYAGQNLANTMFNQTTSVKDIALLQIRAWFDQYSSTTQSDMDRYSPKGKTQISSFTQLMQEKANAVGCAILRQKDKKKNVISQSMACNYAFMNIRGRSVYQTEYKAAKLCQTGVNRNFKNLCSPKENCHVNIL